MDVGRLAKLQEQVELLGEELVIVPRVKAEQRIGLDERTSADHDLGATLRDQVERREFLEHPHWIGGAQHRHRARQPDTVVRAAAAARMIAGAEFEKFRAVMLADTEDVEPDAIRDHDLLDKLGHAIGRRRKPARCRVRKDGCETVDTDFHVNPYRLSVGWCSSGCTLTVPGQDAFSRCRR